MSAKKYCVVQSNLKEDFEAEVSRLLSEGWWTVGGVSVYAATLHSDGSDSKVSNRVYSQAMAFGE